MKKTLFFILTLCFFVSEVSAQLFTNIRYPEENNNLFSKKYLDFVKKSFRME